jgi:hypothetical protein
MGEVKGSVWQYVTAHLVFLEDGNGDVVDANYYCSDFCARTDDAYAGWNGSHPLMLEHPAMAYLCNACGQTI